jgi:Protein of unknown function (DUF3105)
MKSKILLWIAVLLILAACAPTTPLVVKPTPIDVAALETPIPDEGHDQVQAGSQISYQHTPPASGPLYPPVIQYGLYEQDVQAGFWVHILERGGIVFLYKCGAECSTLKQELGDMLDSVPAGEQTRHCEISDCTLFEYGSSDHGCSLGCAAAARSFRSGFAD